MLLTHPKANYGTLFQDVKFSSISLTLSLTLCLSFCLSATYTEDKLDFGVKVEKMNDFNNVKTNAFSGGFQSILFSRVEGEPNLVVR